jgi:sulfate permease, SulP family
VLVPKLFTTLRGYTRAQCAADVTAGVIVGIVALPLAIAFAVASGVTPERGLYTAIVAGFLISALGGSRVQIGGPTGAFIVIVYAIVQQYGLDGLQVAGMMAGVMLIGFGLARFGSVIKFIPHTVIVGFTSGIAVVIFSSQVKDLLGLQVGSVPAAFVPKWRLFAAYAGTFNPAAVGIALGSVLLIALWPRVSRRIPGPIVAVIVATAAVAFFRLPVETIGSRFGAIHFGLPAPAFPHITLARLSQLIGPAFTIALLGSVESLLSAVVADGMIGGRHRSNMELVAQGIANIASPIFGGIPATGAIARTATNVKNGGRTPVAGMIHALTLLLITVVFGRWAVLIPMAALAGILVVVAYHMSEWQSFRSLLRSQRGDVLVLLVTFLLTVFVDLTVAIEVGMVLAAFLFMKQMAGVTNVKPLSHEMADPDAAEAVDMQLIAAAQIPPDVEVYEISGPFFFGAAETFRNALGGIARKPRVLIIRVRHVPAIDASGIHALRTVIRQARASGVRVIVSGAQGQLAASLAQSGLSAEIGEQDLAASLPDALQRASAIDSSRHQ